MFARFFKRLVARSNASPLAFPPFFAPRMKCVLLLYLGAKKKRKKKRAATSGVGGDDGGDEEVNEEEAEGGRVRRKWPLPPSCTLSAEKTTPPPRSRSRSSYRPFTNNKLNLLDKFDRFDVKINQIFFLFSIFRIVRAQGSRGEGIKFSLFLSTNKYSVPIPLERLAFRPKADKSGRKWPGKQSTSHYS